MSQLAEIEKLAKEYAAERSHLGARVMELNEELEAAKRRKLNVIKRSVGLVADVFAKLKAAIEAAPDLFVKPRTYTFHGIKVGFNKGRGKLTWEDDDQVMKLIRKKLPEELHDVLIQTKEHIAEKALENLSAEQLKLIGVRIEDSDDRVVIKPVDGAVDKLVNALLKEAEKDAEKEEGERREAA